MHHRRFVSPLVVPRAMAALAVLAAITLSACSSSTDAAPVPVSGEYLLDTFNGAAMKAHPTATEVIDTGYVKLHATGTYDIYVRRIVNGSAQNYISESGSWSETSRALQFSGPALQDNVVVSTDGKFTINYFVGTQQALGFHRIGDAP